MQTLKLDLRHYETVAAIVEFGTMTEAARHLSSSQSALSHRLSEAERRLGTVLFDRGQQRRLTPTRDGLAIHQAATRVIDDLLRTEASIRSSVNDATTILRIAVGSYDCFHWFPGFLASVRSQHPSIDLELVVVGDEPGAALASHQVDIVIAPGTPEGDIALHPLFEDELVLVTSPDHPLAARTSIDADDLAQETYFTYSALPSPGFEYDRFIRPSHVYPQLVTIVRQTSAITELVAAGTGVAILSRWALHPSISSGRVATAACGPEGLPLQWHAAVRRNDDRPLAVLEDLSRYLQEQPNPPSQ